MAEEQTSQIVDKPVPDAPVESDIDNLLQNIPDLKALFAETPGQPEQPEGAPAPEPGAPETAPEVEIPEGLKPEEEKQPPSEPKKEEPDKVQRRIDELTAKRKAAEERVSALETELSDLKSKFQAPPPIQPTPANPLADIDTPDQLEARKKLILEAKNWCIRNPNGGEVSDGKGGTKFVDDTAVREIWANADQMLAVELPKRQDFLAVRKGYVEEAKREYPALYKQGTEAYTTRLTWLKALPECANFPDIDLIIGDAIIGQKIRFDRAKARAGANGKVLPASQTPLAAPAPAASPKVPQNKALSGEALAAAFAADPSAALDNFVGGLLDAAAAQRARQ